MKNEVNMHKRDEAVFWDHLNRANMHTTFRLGKSVKKNPRDIFSVVNLICIFSYNIKEPADIELCKFLSLLIAKRKTAFSLNPTEGFFLGTF